MEKTVRENESGAPIPMMSNEEMETADDMDKVAFEDGVSMASAKEYKRRGCTHD